MQSKFHWQKKMILIQEAMNTCRMLTAVTYWTVASEIVEWMTLVLAGTVAALVVFSASENPPAQAGTPHVRGLSWPLL